jgi:hypothetical protein
MLITSRIAGFNDNSFRGAEFAIATLIDLTSEQIQAFAAAWFAIVFPADPEAAGRARDDLLETLQRRPQLQTIAGNPMILTIMATVARHKRLGRSRAALYDQALELLCYNWDYKRGLGLPPDSPLIDLQPDDTPLMLRRIGWRMQEVPDGLRANAIEEATLRRIIEDFFQRDWHFDLPKARRAASEMLERLQVRNWVLTLRGPGLYGFVHRTFLEYLCALELSERFKAQQLDIHSLIDGYVVSRLDDDTWHETLRLLLGLLPPIAAEQALLAILPSETLTEADVSRLIFGWYGLAEIEPRHLVTLGTVCNRLTRLLYDWLGKNETDQLAPAMDIAEAAASVGRVVWPAAHPPDAGWPPRAVGDNFSYLHIVAVLGQTIWNCPDAANDIIAAACSDQDQYRRIAAITVLSLKFPNRSNNAKIISALADTDPEDFVRRAALEALANRFHEDPETKILLRARSIEDPDEACRGAALLGLARMLGMRELALLASTNLDGGFPGRDPRRPITLGDIAKGAEKLSEPEERILALYHRLAEEVPLRFSRGVLKPANPRPPKPRRVASSASANVRRPAARPPRSAGGSGTASPRRRGRPDAG